MSAGRFPGRLSGRLSDRLSGPAERDLAGIVEDALGLLAPYHDGAARMGADDRPLGSLLAQCEARAEAIRARAPAPLRVLHHFACTGGTLFARALAAQPGAMVLSEVDPFSDLYRPTGGFAPTDLIHLARQDRSPPGAALTGGMFLAQLETLFAGMRRQGRPLVVRDHSHSHFCAGPAIPDRPLLGAFIGERFAVRGAVTVRHPLDSFLSLRLNGWLHFEPATLAEYARRYHAFLDAYDALPVFRYERFAADPEGECAALCAALEMTPSPYWQDVLPTVTLSGDSGRRGDRVGPRGRRRVPDEIAAETGAPDYRALCTRLAYDPDPAAPADPG